MRIQTKYNIGDAVRVEALDLKGTISRFGYDRAGLQYEVKYLYSGELKYLWCEEADLISLATEDKVGFLVN